MRRNDIYAALTRADVRGTYHWIIYVVINDEEGYKIHATTHGGTTPWTYECTTWNGPRSRLSVTFTLIGHMDDDFGIEMFELYVKDIPMNIIPPDQQPREPNFTCRVWFKEAIRQLDASGMFVKCTDVDALERELWNRAIGFEYQLHNPLPVLLSTEQAVAWS
ncbi:hypothetical protein BDP27DRAFT_1328520 [Rhodocollybia butyracea]|uniref:Uncharacterized protein n=1 Tax=Rhodocollybia butyracea TaxID=206335 RepID=A0A9P5PKX8_9AGAR|nr:hypothetical protein BDP27DRAFT_1328520 [Rhodocollybia butyracea]